MRSEGEKNMSEENKKTVVAFYMKLLREFDAESGIAQYGGETYTQHNPLIEDGWSGVAKFSGWVRANYPQSQMEIKRVFSDGDFVILHCHWMGVPGEAGDAVMDLFRLENGKVVEHWDVIQPIPETAANKNTMF
jgi:predicted SnoaL-like aldol condensation-catalyzing enzyme